MKKQLMLLLGILSLLIPAGVVVSGSASADHEEPCVPTDAVAAVYGPWTDEGDVIVTEENVPPGADTDTVRYLPAGEVDDSTEDQFINLSWHVYTGNVPDGTLPARDDPNWLAVPAMPNGVPHDPVIGVVYNVSHGEAGLGSHFKYDGTFVPGTEDTDYLWQKQVRTFTPGTPAHTCDENPPLTCPDDAEINAGLPVPEGSTIAEYCFIEVQGEQTCPTDSEINAGEEIPEGETVRSFCNEDEKKNNPPDPEGEQETPEVAGEQARAPVGPAVEVPTTVDSGL